MIITVTRRLEFDYGHRVLGHEGKCRFLHGHRGAAEVTVRGPELDSVGRVIDFSVVKVIIGGWIDDRWDHNLLLNERDPQAVHLEKTENRSPYMMDGNPTAENMARELYYRIGPLLPKGLQITHVRLYETPSCWADYEGDEE